MRGTSAVVVLLSLLWFGFSQGPLTPPDCSISVNAGRDTTLCQAGQTVNLQASPSTDIFAVRWSPGKLVKDSTLLSTTAVVSQTTTFRATVYSVLPENLIVNGDFSLGNLGFRSDYQYGKSQSNLGILAEENQYAITKNPTDVHRRFAACGDHTNGRGNMMVINASGQGNSVWCQTIQVRPNTDYVFSAWVSSAVAQNPARLQFSINDRVQGQVLAAPSSTCQWRQFYALWNSGPSTLAEICIVNINFTPAGNDFLLDDLSFSPVCVATDSLTVRVADLRAGWTAPAALCQNEPAFALETLLDQGSTPGGRWTIDRQAAVAVDPALLAPGRHVVNYMVEDGPCRAEKQGEIVVTAVPSAGLALPPLRFCGGTDTLINLSSRLQGASPGGSWTETSSRLSGAGAFSAAGSSFRTAGQAPGTYTFRYQVDAPSPCLDAETTVTITLDPPPAAQAGPDQSLDCVVKSVRLGGNGPEPAPGLQLEWSAAGGGLIPDAFNPKPEIDLAGLYVLTVVDPASGCRATDTVEVVSNITSPVPQVTIQPVTCFGRSDAAILIDSVSDGRGPFLFGIDDGPMMPKNQFPGLTPGRYQLYVEDLNGCTNSVEVFIDQPTELAVVLETNLPGDPPVMLLGDSVKLRALVNVPADRIAGVEWQPAPADSCRNCLNRQVSPLTSTIYSVTVTDINGCRASDRLQLMLERRKNVFIPNAFSPDNDGVNDMLMIYAGPEVAIVRHFRIINRWGDVVYQAQNFQPNDPAFGWNGSYRGQKTRSGVFLYTAEVELVDGKKIALSGDVTVVR